MPWLRFTADMDWKPTPSTTIAYKAGMVQNVTRDCAETAEAAGKGVRLKVPRKGEVPTLPNGSSEQPS